MPAPSRAALSPPLWAAVRQKSWSYWPLSDAVISPWQDTRNCCSVLLLQHDEGTPTGREQMFRDYSVQGRT